MSQPPSFQPPSRRRSVRSQQETNSSPRRAANNQQRAHAPWVNSQAQQSAEAHPESSPASRPSFPSRGASGQPSAIPPTRERKTATAAVNDAPAVRSDSYRRAQAQPPAYSPQRRNQYHSASTASTAPPAFLPQRQRAHSPNETSPNPANSYSPPRRSFPTANSSQSAPAPSPRQPQAKKPRRKRFVALTVIALILVALVAWPVGLVMWANGKLQHVEALSNKPAGKGTTYLIAGSDERSNGADGGITGGPHDSQRADTIILVHWAPNGQKSMVSIPRDTAVELPGIGLGKINSSFGEDGPRGLVAAVENFSGLKVDHYVQVSMGGVTEMVNAVGGLNLCYDHNVDDPRSEMVWKAGCHDVDGKQALAFARMRYSDPLGDIGRTARQRQVITKLVAKATSFPGVLSPARQINLVDGATKAMRVDMKASVIDLAWLALAFKGASSAGLNGVPPIASMDYWEGTDGSKVLITPEVARSFFSKMQNGTLTPQDYQAK